jgi:hypothetical protein
VIKYLDVTDIRRGGHPRLGQQACGDNPVLDQGTSKFSIQGIISSILGHAPWAQFRGRWIAPPLWLNYRKMGPLRLNPP